MNYNSIYTGIVIQNNDPEKAGRIKIFVPGITNTVYDNWNAINENKIFSFIDGSVLNVLDQLQADLPWAECATSTFGGDTNRLNVGNAPVALERVAAPLETSGPKDAFSADKYSPGAYSGSSGGLYSIPNVGSHVFIFFRHGNVHSPVYFASTHSKKEYQEIFKDHYVTDYENSESATATEYSNKHVLNTSKHTLEFIDTDLAEEVKLSHYCGSNIQMLNDYTAKFTVADDYTLIDNDKYETVRNNEQMDVGVNSTYHIGNDRVKNIDNNETITVGTNQTINIGVDQTVDIGANKTVRVGADLMFSVKGTITIQNDGGGSIVIDPGGNVTITGTTINLN